MFLLERRAQLEKGKKCKGNSINAGATASPSPDNSSSVHSNLGQNEGARPKPSTNGFQSNTHFKKESGTSTALGQANQVRPSTGLSNSSGAQKDVSSHVAMGEIGRQPVSVEKMRHFPRRPYVSRSTEASHHSQVSATTNIPKVHTEVAKIPGCPMTPAEISSGSYGMRMCASSSFQTSPEKSPASTAMGKVTVKTNDLDKCKPTMASYSKCWGDSKNQTVVVNEVMRDKVGSCSGTHSQQESVCHNQAGEHVPHPSSDIANSKTARELEESRGKSSKKGEPSDCIERPAEDLKRGNCTNVEASKCTESPPEASKIPLSPGTPARELSTAASTPAAAAAADVSVRSFAEVVMSPAKPLPPQHPGQERSTPSHKTKTPMKKTKGHKKQKMNHRPAPYNTTRKSSGATGCGYASKAGAAEKVADKAVETPGALTTQNRFDALAEEKSITPSPPVVEQVESTWQENDGHVAIKVREMQRNVCTLAEVLKATTYVFVEGPEPTVFTKHQKMRSSFSAILQQMNEFCEALDKAQHNGASHDSIGMHQKVSGCFSPITLNELRKISANVDQLCVELHTDFKRSSIGQERMEKRNYIAKYEGKVAAKSALLVHQMNNLTKRLAKWIAIIDPSSPEVMVPQYFTPAPQTPCPPPPGFGYAVQPKGASQNGLSSGRTEADNVFSTFQTGKKANEVPRQLGTKETPPAQPTAMPLPQTSPSAIPSRANYLFDAETTCAMSPKGVLTNGNPTGINKEARATKPDTGNLHGTRLSSGSQASSSGRVELCQQKNGAPSPKALHSNNNPTGTNKEARATKPDTGNLHGTRLSSGSQASSSGRVELCQQKNGAPSPKALHSNNNPTGTNKEAHATKPDTGNLHGTRLSSGSQASSSGRVELCQQKNGAPSPKALHSNNNPTGTNKEARATKPDTGNLHGTHLSSGSQASSSGRVELCQQKNGAPSPKALHSNNNPTGTNKEVRATKPDTGNLLGTHLFSGSQASSP